MDVYFLNRPGVKAVTSGAQLATSFASPPAGGTPLIGSLSNIFATYNNEARSGRRIIIIVITDGEPSDGSADQLFSILQRRGPNEFESLAECNYNEDEMAYLDGWDTRLQNFDNTDDCKLTLLMRQELVMLWVERCTHAMDS